MKFFSFILIVLLIFCNKICSAVTNNIDSIEFYVTKDFKTIIIDSTQYELIAAPPDSSLKIKCSTDTDSIKCKCLKGKLDAKLYHGNNGSYFILGFVSVFLPIGGYIIQPIIIITSKYTPETGKKTMTMSQNKDLFNDPVYLKCYNKRVKWQIVKMELLGTATAIAATIGLFFILFVN